MMVWASMAAVTLGDEIVDDRRRVMTWSGGITPTGTMFSAVAMTVSAAIATTG